jgi:ribonuclease P protein component
MTPQRDERFPKQARVVNQKDFDRVFRSGLVVSDGTLVVHFCRNNLLRTRLGLSVSKRVGNSPFRNLWKRHAREAFRKLQPDLPVGFDLVVRPRKGASPDAVLVAQSFAKLSHKIRKR